MRVILLVGCLAVAGCENPVSPSTTAESHEIRDVSQVESDSCEPIVTYPEHPWYGGCTSPDGTIYDRNGRVVWQPGD